MQLYWTRFKIPNWESMSVSQWETFLVNPVPVETPIEATAVHLGQGVVQVDVISPLPAEFRRLEVETAPALEGPYQKFSNRFLYQKTGVLYGYLVGTTVYLRIRIEFDNGVYGAWSQVRPGNARYIKALMLCEAPPGSQIPQGALFTAKQGNQRVVGFRADTQIDF